MKSDVCINTNGKLRDAIEESEVQVVLGDDDLPILTELQYSNFANELPVSRISTLPVDAIEKVDETSKPNDEKFE